MAEKSKVVVKKVKPYPIVAKFEKEAKVFYGNIVKLTLTGFLIELNDHFVSVAELYACSFHFPVIEAGVCEPVKVVKTYDQFRPPTHPAVAVDGQSSSDSVAVRVAELHFEKLQLESRDKIKKFLIAIGQIPR